MLDLSRPENASAPNITNRYSPDSSTVKQSVAEGIRQAREDYKVRNVLIVEIIVLATIAGVVKQSWWMFGIVFFGLSACLAFRALSVIIYVAFSLFWGGVVFAIGVTFFSSVAAGVVLGIIAFIGSYSVHESSARWIRR